MRMLCLIYIDNKIFIKYYCMRSQQFAESNLHNNIHNNIVFKQQVLYIIDSADRIYIDRHQATCLRNFRERVTGQPWWLLYKFGQHVIMESQISNR